MRDSQRSRVYAWERAQPWWQYASRGARNAEVASSVVPPLTLPECEKFLSRVLRKAGVSMVPVTDGRGARRATGSLRRVNLPVWARTRSVILHEAAHVIASHRYLFDHHGPLFARIYIDLLARHFHLPPGELLRSARAARVKVAPRNRTGGSL